MVAKCKVGWWIGKETQLWLNYWILVRISLDRGQLGQLVLTSVCTCKERERVGGRECGMELTEFRVITTRSGSWAFQRHPGSRYGLLWRTSDHLASLFKCTHWPFMRLLPCFLPLLPFILHRDIPSALAPKAFKLHLAASTHNGFLFAALFFLSEFAR